MSVAYNPTYPLHGIMFSALSVSMVPELCSLSCHISQPSHEHGGHLPPWNVIELVTATRTAHAHKCIENAQCSKCMAEGPGEIGGRYIPLTPSPL